MFLQAAQPNALLNYLALPVIFLIFYFILIRPGSQRQKKLQQMIENLKVGDKVVTSSGIYGTIMGLKGDRVQLRIADNVKIEMSKNAVTALQNPEEE